MFLILPVFLPENGICNDPFILISMLINKLKSRLILQIHDELLVETAVDEIDIVKDILTKGMKEAASLKVPLEIDIKQGDNWLEAH